MRPWVTGLFWRCGVVFRRSRNAVAGAATWVVDDGGGADFVSIYAAVDATCDGMRLRCERWHDSIAENC